MSRKIPNFDNFLQATDGVRLLFFQVRELSRKKIELRSQGGRAAYIHEYSEMSDAEPDIQQLRDKGAIEVDGEIDDEMVFS